MMRPAYLFPAIAAAGAASLVGVGHALAAPVAPLLAAYAVGVGFTIFASIVVNSCNAARYGRQVWEDQGGDMDGVARHADHMPAAPGAGHAETYVSFPGNAQ